MGPFQSATARRLYDELAWRDVALHACRVLQTNEKVVFATAWQMAAGGAQLRYAQDDGYRIVVVPEDIARSLSGLTDLNGKPLVDLDGYRNEWNASSETMRLNETGNPVLGLWEQAERRIIIRRDQLNAFASYAGTLLHEVGHMTSGATDGSLDFESELSRLLGMTAAAALGARP